MWLLMERGSEKVFWPGVWWGEEKMCRGGQVLGREWGPSSYSSRLKELICRTLFLP